jgi:hypothetical protein
MMMDFESETRVGWYRDTTLKWLESAFVGLFILIWFIETHGDNSVEYIFVFSYTQSVFFGNGGQTYSRRGHR